MSEKYYSRLATNLVMIKDNKILLQLRQNTGYMDGMYDFACSGHVESGESFSKALVREAKEEIGIDVLEEDLEFLAINHDYEKDHVQLFFKANKFEGEPHVCESEECGELLWADLDNLPNNIIPYVEGVIKDIQSGIKYNDGNFTKSQKDFRFEKKASDDELHKRRRAFVILNDELYFIEKGSTQSHWEYCIQTFPNITKEEFNTLVRGFYLDGDIVFYKGKFEYDDEVINVGLKHIVKIKELLEVESMEIYFGEIVDTTKDFWPYDYHYGMINENNKIIKRKK